MALSSLHHHNSFSLTLSRFSTSFSSSSSIQNTTTQQQQQQQLARIWEVRERLQRRTETCRFVVSSTHSNPRILKLNRKSRFGDPLSTYDTDDDDDRIVDDDDDDWLSDLHFADIKEDDDDDEKDYKSKKALKQRTARNRRKEKVTNGKVPTVKRKVEYLNQNSSEIKERKGREYQGKLITRESIKDRFPRLLEEINVDTKWYPLIDYLSAFGLKDSHFIQIYERHMSSLQINVCSAQERLDYLLSVGLKERDVRKVLLRQPQILQYTVENNLKPHISFLRGLGIQSSKIGNIIAAAPSLFSYSVENSLKPTVRYLVEEVGIKEKDLGKVVQLSPQILVQRIDISWNMRYIFLSKELGAPKDSVAKMVTKHPQLLHYSIDDGLLPKINFLRSIGMSSSDILKILTKLTQVLSLSVEANMKPKYLYLVNELHNDAQSLTKYPTYLSLSLDQRIRPRHRFLVSLKKVRKGPFPLGSLVPTDECFCQQWAGTSLDKYLEFRQRLSLKDLAKKYERR